MRKILQALGEYPHTDDPHGQMDEEVARRCLELSKKPDLCADDVKDLLDDCVMGAMCTDFVIMALDAVWKELRLKPSAAHSG